MLRKLFKRIEHNPRLIFEQEAARDGLDITREGKAYANHRTSLYYAWFCTGYHAATGNNHEQR